MLALAFEKNIIIYDYDEIYICEIETYKKITLKQIIGRQPCYDERVSTQMTHISENSTLWTHFVFSQPEGLFSQQFFSDNCVLGYGTINSVGASIYVVSLPFFGGKSIFDLFIYSIDDSDFFSDFPI